MIQSQNDHTPLTVEIDGAEHLILMRCIEDDRFGNQDKSNGAYVSWPAPQFAVSGYHNIRSYDSIINALPAEHYYRITGLTDVTGLARFSAPEWRLRILSRTANLAPLLIHEERGSGEADIALITPLSRRPYRLYFELSWSGALEIDLLAWTTPKPKALQPLGVSITTYNKAAYLLPNLDILAQSASYGAGLLDILVVNNGDALPEEPAMAEVLKLPNVGGTGGFLAGHAHFKAKGYRHFVIMDDDIAILPDFIDRIFGLSCFARDQHVGSMAEILNISDRIVKEQGANVSGPNIFGIDLINPFTDLQGWDRHRVYGYYEVDFSGWWSLMVDLDGPAPAMPERQFIKRDDIMFGYESRLGDVPTIVPPNLVVAHGEEGAPAYYYYDIRNDLILRARNVDGLSLSVMQLLRIAGYLMLSLQVDRQKMFNAALADFMAGPDWLDRTDIGKTLRRVRGMAAKAQPIPKAPSDEPEPRAKPTGKSAEEDVLAAQPTDTLAVASGADTVVAQASDSLPASTADTLVATDTDTLAQTKPKAQARLGGGDRPPTGALLGDWIKRSAWRTRDPLPIVEHNPLLHARGQGAYLDVVPFTDTAYLRQRRIAGPVQFARAFLLLARLYVIRDRLIRAYKKAGTRP